MGEAEENVRKSIFISYTGHAESDKAVATALYESLASDFDVFIYLNLEPGKRWGHEVDQALQRADFFIVLLSAVSVGRDMVVGEVAKAYNLAQERDNRPLILPVRLAYKEELPYPLYSYLQPITYVSWEDETSTTDVISQLKKSISADISNSKNLIFSHSTNIKQSEKESKSISTLYVERESTKLAMKEISRQGVTITIKSPRQMGKTLLLKRLLEKGIDIGKRVVRLNFLYFESIDRNALRSSSSFFRIFCSHISEQLKIPDLTNGYWNQSLGNIIPCTHYFSDYILKTVDVPLVIGMDNVDSIVGAEFCSEFFNMLRGWHTKRRTDEIWQKLDLVVVLSTEPYEFITDLNKSPFNASDMIELEDFTSEQVQDLNRLHDSPLTQEEVSQLIELVGGHPYLIRRALYLVTNYRKKPSDLFVEATNSQNPFLDHLHYFLRFFRNQSHLKEGLCQIILRESCSEDVYFRLESFGLVKRDGFFMRPRCQLYEEFFKNHWILEKA